MYALKFFFCRSLSTGKKRSLEFYMDKTMSIDPDKLASYIETGRNMLENLDIDEDEKPKLIEHAGIIAETVNKIRLAMKPDLDTEFTIFKANIAKEIDEHK